MKESILDVLMYLFVHHMEDSSEVEMSDEILVHELEEAGFEIDEISLALEWLDGLFQPSHVEKIKSLSFRTLCREEKNKISSDCWGLILHLENMKVINPTMREIIIDRLMNLNVENIEPVHVKWVALMVLFNHIDRKDVFKTMENFLLLENAQLN